MSSILYFQRNTGGRSGVGVAKACDPGCNAVFAVCRSCDPGQRYCSAACRKRRRQQQLRAAGRRYRATDSGRISCAKVRLGIFHLSASSTIVRTATAHTLPAMLWERQAAAVQPSEETLNQASQTGSVKHIHGPGPPVDEQSGDAQDLIRRYCGTSLGFRSSLRRTRAGSRATIFAKSDLGGSIRVYHQCDQLQQCRFVLREE